MSNDIKEILQDLDSYMMLTYICPKDDLISIHSNDYFKKVASRYPELKFSKDFAEEGRYRALEYLCEEGMYRVKETHRLSYRGLMHVARGGYMGEYERLQYEKTMRNRSSRFMTQFHEYGTKFYQISPWLTWVSLLLSILAIVISIT